MSRAQTLRRRTALGIITAGFLSVGSGCSDGNRTGPDDSRPTADQNGDSITGVDVDGFSLVVDRVREPDADRSSIVDPNGNLLAERPPSSGRTERFDIAHDRGESDNCEITVGGTEQ